ncbi:MAG: hypothetical protein O7G31_13855 [Calditrichaeota bacterium]|nr:hypothetical protein [Calditrichota bacterium]
MVYGIKTAVLKQVHSDKLAGEISVLTFPELRGLLSHSALEWGTLKNTKTHLSGLPKPSHHQLGW